MNTLRDPIFRGKVRCGTTPKEHAGKIFMDEHELALGMTSYVLELIAEKTLWLNNLFFWFSDLSPYQRPYSQKNVKIGLKKLKCITY